MEVLFFFFTPLALQRHYAESCHWRGVHNPNILQLTHFMARSYAPLQPCQISCCHSGFICTELNNIFLPMLPERSTSKLKSSSVLLPLFSSIPDKSTFPVLVSNNFMVHLWVHPLYMAMQNYAILTMPGCLHECLIKLQILFRSGWPFLRSFLPQNMLYVGVKLTASNPDHYI